MQRAVHGVLHHPQSLRFGERRRAVGQEHGARAGEADQRFGFGDVRSCLARTVLQAMLDRLVQLRFAGRCLIGRAVDGTITVRTRPARGFGMPGRLPR